ARKWDIELDKAMLGFIAGQRVNKMISRWLFNVRDAAMLEKIVGIIAILKSLSLDVNLWKAQNAYFAVGKKILKSAHGESARHEPDAVWMEQFRKLGNLLQVSIG
ncbi:MAG: hypothetical protein ABH885_03325, partial [Candidatus Omnitrophota bacterium]